MDWMPVVGNVLGSVASGLFGKSNAAEQMEKQNQMQIENYKHRYQWAVQDMRAAGLNPILAATQGISGNVQGVSVPAINSSSPDFGAAMSSAFQTSSQKEIAKLQNDVAKENLRLEELRINNAKEKQDNDIKIDNMMADINKWKIEEENKRAWLMNDAQIENLKETLRIQEEHFIRADEAAHLSAEASMSHAAAAWFSASVQDKLAAVAEKTGFSQQELNTAHKILMDTQARDTAAVAEWHEYLNEHPHIRGAVGFVSSFLDVAGLAYRTSGYGKTLTNGVQAGW